MCRRGRAVRVVETLCEHDEATRRMPRSTPGLRLVFAARGPGDCGQQLPQMSDGAGAVLLMSEAAVKRYGVTPIARFVRLFGGGRAAAGDGHRPGRGDPGRLKAGGHAQSQPRLDRAQRAFAASRWR